MHLEELNMTDLAGVVNLYPWYGPARQELCRRLAALGSGALDKSPFAEAALYLPLREKLAGIFHGADAVDFSDKDLSELLKSLLEPSPAENPAEKKQVRVIGGDYFTQAQYDNVRLSDDNVFSRFAVKASIEKASEEGREQGELDESFCTEPLAQIYAEQGYPEQAKRIYSKLLLKFPEKSAYFAALIENLN